MNACHLRRLLAAALLAALSAAAVAGHQADHRTAARPDPLDAGAAVPPLRHESAFAAYRAQSATPLAPWKAANDTVERIGGWRAYTREAQTPAAPASAPAPAARHAH
jgi:hypothetical protein